MVNQHDDSHNLSTDRRLADSLQTQHKPRAPPLDISEDEEDDYVRVDNISEAGIHSHSSSISSYSAF